jgi:hypothetical protein
MNGGDSTLEKSVANILFLTVNDANISDKCIEQSSLYPTSIWAWPALLPGRGWGSFSNGRESENSLINLKRFKTYFTD